MDLTNEITTSLHYRIKKQDEHVYLIATRFQLLDGELLDLSYQMQTHTLSDRGQLAQAMSIQTDHALSSEDRRELAQEVCSAFEVDYDGTFSTLVAPGCLRPAMYRLVNALLLYNGLCLGACRAKTPVADDKEIIQEKQAHYCSAVNSRGERTATRRQFIATGVVFWQPAERASERYGAIFLRAIPGGDIVPLPAAYDGEEGTLMASIRESRRSPHIGDRFRGFRPPEEPLVPGTEVILGTGVVFREPLESGRGFALGVQPADGRERDWLDPEALYKLHYQTVDLFFDPTP
jgi:hypothetical protein